MSNLPIQFIDKENSPALLAFMQQFGEHTYVDAELINKFRDAINELHTTKVPIVGGKIPTEYLPSYVDDVIEGYYNGTSFYTDALFTNLITPESSKIYINLAVTPATQYRWSGSAYVQIGGGKKWENHLFASAGNLTLPADQKNLHQSRLSGITVIATPGLTFGIGIPESAGNLDLSYLSDVANPRITGNYISKIKAVELSYTRNISELTAGQETNIMLSIMTDKKYKHNMQLIVRHNFISNSTIANAENKVSIPILEHLSLDPFSNIKWCVRVNNATAQSFTMFRLNVITEEI